MALSSAQKLQALRLPVVDASVTSGDKHAFLGLIVTATSVPTLTAAQRRQILRLPVIDASVSTSDKFAFLGLMESADSGALYEQFNTTWLLDPTWLAFELPLTNDGNVFIEIGGFGSGFAGAVVNPIAVVPAVDIGTPITNLTAEVDGFGRYFIDDRTGFRLYPHEAVQEWTGFFVRKRHLDKQNPQEFRKGSEKSLSAATRSETEDTFITTSIAPEDL